ncbi:MAG: hypothetical protein N3G21_01775 [Candidatus Hydrogenedentes bacterium]|nr:hypothetical protein [Candidatus Hydrogenedentota bacterium]
MRKISFAVMVVAVGTGIALASSLAIPWFADTAPPAAGLPHKAPNLQGATNLVYLKSNVDTTLVCSIEYYNGAGQWLGPPAPYNTFTIAPKSALAFRPCVVDPGPAAGSGSFVKLDPATGNPVTVNYTGAAGGQEGSQAVKVPDRPRSPDANTPIAWAGVVDTATNGSAVISWVGGPQDVQGANTNFITVFEPNGSRVTLSYGHLLPPGI